MSWLSVRLGRLLLDALQEAKKAKDSDNTPGPSLAETIASPRQDPLGDSTPETQFSVVRAVNGRLVRVSTYKPTKTHHPDWTHEIYIVKDDEKVPDVIARIMAIKALEQ